MMTKEEYKKTLIRMWDSIRDDGFKGESCCNGISCGECPINFGCGSVIEYNEVVEFVEKWANEHPVETNGSRFLKNYPKAWVFDVDNESGLIYINVGEAS